jgi:hypothetical protein
LINWREGFLAMPATNLVFELPAEPADIETRPLEDRASLAAELRRLADVLNAEADKLDGGWLTTQEAAEAIGRSEECIRQWIRRYGIGYLDARAHRFVVSRSKLVAHMLQAYGRLPHGLASSLF